MKKPHIHVFDVDDTLIDTQACIRAIDSEGNIVFRAGTKVFNAPDSTARLLTPGLKWDFTEFESLDQMMSEPKRAPFKRLMQEAAINRNNCYICTCRQKRQMLWRWLTKNGIHIPIANIFCYDNTTGLSPADWKAETICSTAWKYDCGNVVVHIYEDDEHFKEAILEDLSLALINYVEETI